jgi:RNA polymerase sigma-70 factor (ECF subfamily)
VKYCELLGGFQGVDTDVRTELRLGTAVIMATGSDDVSPDQRLGALYRAHADALARYAIRCGVAGDDVEDVIADVFVVAWRKLDAMPAAPRDRLWLFGVTRNIVAKHWEGRWRRGRLIERLEGTVPASGVRTASDEILLRDAIGRLPAKDRDVVRLVLWEGLTHDQVAAVLGCSANASRLRFHRAKARLRTVVEAEELDR